MSFVGNFNHLRISKEEGIISNSRYLEDKILPRLRSRSNSFIPGEFFSSGNFLYCFSNHLRKIPNLKIAKFGQN